MNHHEFVTFFNSLASLAINRFSVSFGPVRGSVGRNLRSRLCLLKNSVFKAVLVAVFGGSFLVPHLCSALTQLRSQVWAYSLGIAPVV
jgi:hypothetical protein